MLIFDLKPLPEQKQKSFYGKAEVHLLDDGTQVLYSYGTEICRKNPDGSLTKIYKDWTNTTGRHIKAFCGLSKKEYENLK